MIVDAPLWNTWRLLYVDGSMFSSTQGEWVEAPQGVVQTLELWYGPDVPDGPHKTETSLAAFYVWVQEMGYPVHTWEYVSRLRLLRRVKFGEWIAGSRFHQIASQARTMKPPYPKWTMYYANSLVYSADEGTWLEAPLDRVVGIVNAEGVFLSGSDYYYWDNGVLKNTNSQEAMLKAVPEIKIGMTSYVTWPPTVNPLYKEILHDTPTSPP